VVARVVALMKTSVSRPLFALAVVGCFALAFGVAYVVELALIWFLEIRLGMWWTNIAGVMVTIWRGIASLAVALLLCIWMTRR
jgi:hypothetical protein